MYNLDNTELNFNFSETNNIFPPSIHFNNKIFYFIVIYIGKFKSARKIGAIKEIEITEDELTKKG